MVLLQYLGHRERFLCGWFKRYILAQPSGDAVGIICEFTEKVTTHLLKSRLDQLQVKP
jgi:hypothetical protein